MIFREEARDIEVQGSYDVIVCGGGPAGLSTAISAARQGLKVLLLEVGGCIGGVWTSGLLSVILDVEGKGGLIKEIKTKLDNLNATLPRGNKYNFLYDAESMKAVLEGLCVEAGVQILLHTRVVAAVYEDRDIQGVIVENCEGRQAYIAKIFVDCTGNGDFAALAGCDYSCGHPENGKLQPASLQAIVTGVPEEYQNMETYEEKQGFYKFIKEIGLDVTNKAPTIVRLPGKGLYVFSVNHEIGVRYDSATEITKATLRARMEINSTISRLRRVKGWENLQLICTADHIGVREGRRIKGLYTLLLEDIIAGRKFDDGICLARFAVDIHALDVNSLHGYSNEGINVKPYNIPYRSLVAADKNNLGMAGRCISGDFYAHASYRVTGNSVPTGEAMGFAAALAVRTEKSLAEVDACLVAAEMKKRGYEI